MLLQRRQVSSIAAVAFAMAAGMVLGLSTGLLGAAREARAQPSEELFLLCKEWTPQGATAEPRAFSFEVSDSSQSPPQSIIILNVAEDGQPQCVPTTAQAGPIRVSEIPVPGFDTPVIRLDEFELGSALTFVFLLGDDVCGLPVGQASAVTGLRQALQLPIASCFVTFINEDNDVATPTPTPVTPTRTPTIGVCAICNLTATPPPPTATRTSPPATATNTSPPSQPPPPATPTAGVATQAPGLTDAQRTQTAVAAARTAAAQTTPIAPRTGGAAMGGAGGPLNIALFAAGLIVLSSGLALVAIRGKRR